MKVAFTYNQKEEADSEEPPDEQAEFDSPETISAIRNALESFGHEVVMIEADQNAFSRLRESKPDMVFNIAEGLKGECRESQIPIFCEMLGLPYTGSGPLALAITLDKARTKEILSCYGIPTPKFQVFRKSNESFNHGLVFPMIVKPLCEGSSKGITNDCLVRNEEGLRKKVDDLIKTYKQPVIAEVFLDGREFTVSLIGNGNPEILPIVEVCFDQLPEGVNRFDSYDAKWIYDNPESGKHIENMVKCPAEIPKELKNQIKRVCLEAYKALGCRDFCRIDLRLDSKGVPNILEVNALAGLIPDPKENSRFPKAAYTAGMTYNQIIGRILEEGIKRSGIENEKNQ
ncbi:MAG: ATP-grasp domain-containing protein [Candidatus Aenigmarchaeota archaeon]|nr:ATP-grasp domain-containing protein [Candidatus Aenigmarchaeota archaeon]